MYSEERQFPVEEKTDLIVVILNNNPEGTKGAGSGAGSPCFLRTTLAQPLQGVVGRRTWGTLATAGVIEQFASSHSSSACVVQPLQMMVGRMLTQVWLKCPSMLHYLTNKAIEQRYWIIHCLLYYHPLVFISICDCFPALLLKREIDVS